MTKEITTNKSFIIYTDYKFILNFLSNEEKGELLSILIDFAENNIEPIIDNKQIKNAFDYIKNRIIDNQQKWNKELEKKSLAGKLGMQKRWKKYNSVITENNSVITDYNTIITDDNLNGNVNVNNNDNVKDNINYNVNNKTKMLPRNNIVTINNIDNKKTLIGQCPTEINIKQKDKYGQFNNVLLTKEEYTKLQELYSNKLNEAIDFLSSSIESKGYKYKSHYAVMGKSQWVYKKIMLDNNKIQSKNSNIDWSKITTL